MDVAIEEITRALQANNGSLPYRALVDAVPFRSYALIPAAFKRMRSLGLAYQTVGPRAQDGSVPHIIHLGARP